MPYSDFTLKKVRQDLAIAIHEGGRFFPDVPAVKLDDLLRQELEKVYHWYLQGVVKKPVLNGLLALY